MKRRDLVSKLKGGGYWSKGGTKHEKFTNGETTVMVPRHREIPENEAKAILREAGLE